MDCADRTAELMRERHPALVADPAGDADVQVEVEVGGEGRRAYLAQAAVEVEAGAAHRCGEALGEVDLVDVAGGDVGARAALHDPIDGGAAHLAHPAEHVDATRLGPGPRARIGRKSEPAGQSVRIGVDHHAFVLGLGPGRRPGFGAAEHFVSAQAALGRVLEGLQHQQSARRTARIGFVVADLEQPEALLAFERDLHADRLAIDAQEGHAQNAARAGGVGIGAKERAAHRIDTERRAVAALPALHLDRDRFIEQSIELLGGRRQHFACHGAEFLGMALGPAKIGAPAGIELGFGVDPLRIERERRRRIGRADLAQATPLHRALERRDESRIGRHAFECERRSRAHQGIGKRCGGFVIGA